MLSFYVTVVLQGEGSAIISVALLGHFRRANFSSAIPLLGILRRAMFSSPRFFKRRGLMLPTALNQHGECITVT